MNDTKLTEKEAKVKSVDLYTQIYALAQDLRYDGFSITTSHCILDNGIESISVMHKKPFSYEHPTKGQVTEFDTIKSCSVYFNSAGEILSFSDNPIEYLNSLIKEFEVQNA